MAIVLVTGADDGLGAALAVGLAQDGHVVVAASPDGGRPAAATDDLLLESVAIDLADPDSIRRGVDEVTNLFGGLDIVIVGRTPGALVPMELLPREVLDESVARNMVGPIQLVQACVPALRRSADGRIIALSSLAGVVGLPASGACSAVQSGLEAALEAWRYELMPDGIKVSVVQTVGNDPVLGSDVTGRADRSLYGPLLHTARELRRRACDWCDDDLVLAAVRRLIAADDPEFHHTLGAYAALANELRRADDVERSTAIRRLYRLDEWVVRVAA